MRVDFLDDPIEQGDQLRRWELEREPLLEAVMYGQSFYNECTLNDQRGFRFIIAYDKIGRRLRELIRSNGWSFCDKNNQVAIKNEYLKLRLYACNFCSLTASPDHQPTNLSDKGSSVRGDTYSNAQLTLFDAPHFVPDAEQEVRDGFTTLILGVNYEGEHPKAEVSVPVRYAKGKLKGFSKRVPLLLGYHTPVINPPKHQSEDAFGEVDIPIRVRS